MTDSIRKVGGLPTQPPEDTRATSGASFRDSLSGAQESGRAQAAATQSADAGHELSKVATALSDGSMSAAQAVEALVERALNAPAARALTDAGRAELARHLRSTLAEDPTLRAMQQELERR